MRNNQVNWLLALIAVVLLGAAVITIRAAERATQHSGTAAGSTTEHPPASAPEESATIADDPTTAPDPSQSADKNVSFPTDI